MNRHGLKLKKKNIITLLRITMEKRDGLNDKIKRLESAKSNISKQLSESKKK